MRREKPAPNGASFSELSIGPRHPKATATATKHQEGTGLGLPTFEPEVSHISLLIIDTPALRFESDTIRLSGLHNEILSERREG